MFTFWSEIYTSALVSLQGYEVATGRSEGERFTKARSLKPMAAKRSSMLAPCSHTPYTRIHASIYMLASVSGFQLQTYCCSNIEFCRELPRDHAGGRYYSRSGPSSRRSPGPCPSWEPATAGRGSLERCFSATAAPAAAAWSSHGSMGDPPFHIRFESFMQVNIRSTRAEHYHAAAYAWSRAGGGIVAILAWHATERCCEDVQSICSPRRPSCRRL